MDEYMDDADFPSPPPSILRAQEETPISGHQFPSNNVVGGGYKRPHHSSDGPDDSVVAYCDKHYGEFTTISEQYSPQLPEELDHHQKEQMEVNPPVFKDIMDEWKTFEKERATRNDPPPRYEKENGFKASNQFGNSLLPSEKGQERRQNFGESSGANHSSFKKPRLQMSKALTSHHLTPDSRSSNLRPATQHNNHELRPSISDDGHPNYATYTTSFASIPTPNISFRVSSQRHDAYNPNMMRNPPSSSIASFQQHGHAIRRLNLDDSLVSFETTNQYIPESDFERFQSRLRAKLTNERNRLREAKQTVTYWHKKEKKNYSWNEICAHALLLISELRIATYQELIARVQTFQHMAVGPPPISMDVRSTFTIFSMNIHLSPSYFLKSTNNDNDYVFIAVGSSGEKIIATQLFQISDAHHSKSHSIIADDKLVFKNLPINFRIEFCVYVMKLVPRGSTPKIIAKKAISLFTKKTSQSSNLNTSARSKKDEDVLTLFEPAGKFVLYRSAVGQQSIFLNEPIYPLQGSIEVHSKVSSLPPEFSIEVKGFWKLFTEDGDVIDFFVKMKDGLLNFSNLPSNGSIPKSTKFMIDCSTICDPELLPLPQDDEGHPFRFYINTVTLARGQTDPEQQKFLIAVEKEDQFNVWLRSINIVLEVIRGQERIYKTL